MQGAQTRLAGVAATKVKGSIMLSRGMKRPPFKAGFNDLQKPGRTAAVRIENPISKDFSLMAGSL
ncbi:MAG: hypothetical protein GX335_10400 [Firmicutes bacterium]|nr:hypothetical protein [Bacillota bacterium]